jgi:hypothetical protein
MNLSHEVRTITNRPTRTYYRIKAYNRFGHSTVYAANDSLLDLIKVSFKAVWAYQWIKLDISHITEQI